MTSPSSSADAAPRPVADETTWVPWAWVVGFGALALLGAAVAASREGTNVRVGILNGITGHWAGTWAAFTPDTFGELVSRLKYPEWSVEKRQLTDEWIGTHDLYQSMMRLHEMAPSHRTDVTAWTGDRPLSVERYTRVHSAIRGSRAREVLSESERRLLRDFVEALDAWRRVSFATRSEDQKGTDSQAEVRVSDLAKVLFTSEESIKAPMLELLNADIDSTNAGIMQQVRSLKGLQPESDEAVRLRDVIEYHESQRDWLTNAKRRLELRGVMAFGYLRTVYV